MLAKYVHATSCSFQPDSRSDGQTDHESGRTTGGFAKEIPIVGRRNLDPKKNNHEILEKNEGGDRRERQTIGILACLIKF